MASFSDQLIFVLVGYIYFNNTLLPWLDPPSFQEMKKVLSKTLYRSVANFIGKNYTFKMVKIQTGNFQIEKFPSIFIK